MLAGNRVPATAAPIALAYAGHQFGHWVPQLGDGRALLLGELIDRHGRRRDIQLKGSGVTPFSRNGDGRAPIGPVVREYLASEAMAALGIPTTRALAAVTTGETVHRQRPEPGGVLTRVAASHVRVGTFEYFAARGEPDAIRTLADHVIARHYPALAEAANPYRALFEAVCERTAILIADWMRVGFIHGVMNSDNTSLAGETIDFGPFGFLDAWQPDTVYSSIDRHGRYAFDQQPSIAQWNLTRLAETLVPLFDADQGQAIDYAKGQLHVFMQRFGDLYHGALLRKIGIEAPRDGDSLLVFDLLERMAREGADMTLTFRGLGELASDVDKADAPVRALFRDPASFDTWAVSWRQRLADEGRDDAARRAAMQAVNPAFILRNHLAQRAVDAATERLDFAPMEALLNVLARPYEDQPEHRDLQLPPQPGEEVLRTFCGT